MQNNVRNYKIEASPELKDYFEQKYQGVFVDQFTEIIDSVYLDPTFANLNYTFENWWATSSAAFNQLKEVEKYSADLITEKANEELSDANTSIIISLTILLSVFALILITMISVSTGIIKSIAKITGAVEKMANGFVGEILDIQTNDEIGKLSTTFNKMSLATEGFSKIADEISNGNYTAIVNPRSEDDKLAFALENMKESLGRLAKDNEIRNWLLTGATEMNDKLRGEKDVRSIL